MNNGNYYKNLRISKKYKITQLAEMLDITERHLNYIEKGQRHPSKKLMLKYSEIFDVQIEEIFLNSMRTIGA